MQEAIDKMDEVDLVSRNILNLFNSNPTIENLIKEFIQQDEIHFTKKFSKIIEETKYRNKSDKKNVDKILDAMIKYYASGPYHLETLIRILKKEFFSFNQKYVDLFHDRYIQFLNYHFNVRKIFKFTWTSNKKDENALFKEVVEKFRGVPLSNFSNKPITLSSNFDSQFVNIRQIENGLEITEKLGVVYPKVNSKIKSVYVRYTFDFKNNFFEISYNENLIREICKVESSDKKIIVQPINKEPISEKFNKETELIVNLKDRITKALTNIVQIKSIRSPMTHIALTTEQTDESELEIDSLIEEVDEINPSDELLYEFALYKYFKDDKESLLETILKDNKVKNSSEVESILKEKFKEIIDEENIDSSIKFLMNMQMYSVIKKNTNVINKMQDYIFMFTVKDLEVTKSTTRNSERLPIYDTDFYWHLQEVIDTAKSLTELGVRLTCTDDENKTISQEVKISMGTDHISFIYFQNEKTNNNAKLNHFNLAQGRTLIHEYFKNKFESTVSKKSRS